MLAGQWCNCFLLQERVQESARRRLAWSSLFGFFPDCHQHAPDFTVQCSRQLGFKPVGCQACEELRVPLCNLRLTFIPQQ